MSKKYVSNDTSSVRMFKNDFLEAMSKVHFSVPLFIYLPVIAYFIYRSMVSDELSLIRFSCYLVLGIAIWSLSEYLLHRFVFHFEPSSSRAKRLHFIFHGVHHDYPNDVKRLVMPPSVSIPLASLFYFLFGLILQRGPLYAFFTGFIAGYLFYDMTHYALHHLNFKNKFWKKLKRHHMMHHYAHPNKDYGVSSSFWDKIFNSDYQKPNNSPQS